MFEVLKILIGIVSTASLVAFLYLILIAIQPLYYHRLFRIFRGILDETPSWHPMYAKSIGGGVNKGERLYAYMLVVLCHIFLGISVYAGVTQALWWVPRSFGFVDDYDDFTSYIGYFSAILCVVVPLLVFDGLLRLTRQSDGWRQYKEEHYRFTESISRINVSNDSNSK